MNKERELLKIWVSQFGDLRHDFDLLVATRKLLAEPEKEPVAWRKWDGYGFVLREYDNGGKPLYLAPQKREPAQTAREMYQRGYAAAERDLKREPLSDDEVIVPEWMFTRDECIAFAMGVKFAEKAHGIGGGE